MVVSLRNINNNYSLGKKNNVQANAQNISFNGNFSGSVEKFANKFASGKKVQKFISGKFFNKFLKTSLENPALYEAMLALGITCTARPLTILATPGAKMEDKQYASAQSISSGVVGLISTYLLFNSVEKALDGTIIDVNSKNVAEAFRILYNDKEQAGLVDKLIENKVIPTREEFKNIQNSDLTLYQKMKDYFVENGKKQEIESLLTGDDTKLADSWRKLANDFSNALNKAYQGVKNNGIEDKKLYLVHDKIKFQPELKYNIIKSVKAEKMKFVLGYSTKFIAFPLLALSTIWAIPKIMKALFPNHKKFKKNNAKVEEKAVNNASSNNTIKTTDSTNTAFKNSTVFNNFKKPALNNTAQVSFSGGIRLGKAVKNTYQNLYEKPLSFLLNKIYSPLVYSKGFSNKVNNWFQNDTIKKHGMEVLNRNATGKIMQKHDSSFFVSNLSDITAIWGSCLYIFNTIRNKEIDKERKPALCANLGLVALFSLIASRHINKLTDPIFEALQKTHSKLLDKKINYDANAAWKYAKKILITTIAFRYLGPVLATPAADKVVKLFNTTNKQKAEAKKA